MFWVALAALIMAMTGEGDDTALVRAGFDRLQDGVQDEVPDSERRARALATVDDGRKLFFEHRARLARSGRCVEKLDRTYAVTRDTYLACLADQSRVWEEFVANYNDLGREFSASVTPAEAARVRARMAAP